jgi:O-antigen chain-terminating methyltransferase
MVEQCVERGLAVENAEALSYLRSLPDRSVGAITSFHVLEHVPFAALLEILSETVRVLRPGGVAIFETPNPKNLVVGACQFYVDPTHRNPLHPDTLAFLAEARGLNRVRTLYLHPVDECYRLPNGDSPVTQRLNEYLYGPQDFAVVGYRA